MLNYTNIIQQDKCGSYMIYIFMGGIYPKEKEKLIFQKAKGKLSFAANRHQWAMIDGLEENLGASLSIINEYFVPYFPKYSDLFIHKYYWNHKKNSRDVNVSFINLRGIRNIGQAQNSYKELKKVLNRNKQEKVTVFVYTMRFSQMRAVYRLKNEGYQFHACLIVPDVPSVLARYGNRRDLYSRISSSYNLKAVEKYTKAMDSFVLLSEPMKELIQIGTRPYCIVDGLFSEFEESVPIDTKQTEKRIVYTGSLHREYGICELIDAFKKLEGTDYRLYIAGSGNAVDYVKDSTVKDNRIQYVGLLEAEEVKKLQLSATVLVNPRSKEGIDAKYSFPSKTIEYMLRERPVLMNRLPGMDPEYENYIFTPERCGVSDFAHAIEYICNLTNAERSEFAENARKYVVENKNHIVQMRKVLDMIREK